MVEKIRPGARLYQREIIDGRAGLRKSVLYYCPNCGKKINEDDIACDNCGTFFDWSKKAKVVIREEIEWR